MPNLNHRQLCDRIKSVVFSSRRSTDQLLKSNGKPVRVRRHHGHGHQAHVVNVALEI
jgi:hypothetical protein